MTKTMRMNLMKYYNIAIYYMSNIKNIVFFIGGGAIGLGTLYFVYNNFQNVSKYDKNCKYCLENNITKQKIFIESMIKDKNNEIKENKINLENINKYIKSQK